MKNRLLAYGFGQDSPEKPKTPERPAKGPRARRGKGKRLIARITEFREWVQDGEHYQSVNAKVCLYLDGAGQYYVRGEKVTPQEALRSCLVWEFHASRSSLRVERELVDKAAMEGLLERVLPHESARDDDEGDEWKTAAE